MRKGDIKRSLWDLAKVIEIPPGVDGKELPTIDEPDPPEGGDTQTQQSSEALHVDHDDPVAQPAPSAPPSLMTPPDDSPRMRPQRAARTAGRRRVQEICQGILED